MEAFNTWVCGLTGRCIVWRWYKRLKNGQAKLNGLQRVEKKCMGVEDLGGVGWREEYELLLRKGDFGGRGSAAAWRRQIVEQNEKKVV